MVQTRGTEASPARRTRSKSKDLTDVPVEELEFDKPAKHHSSKKKKPSHKEEEDDEPPKPISSDSEQEVMESETAAAKKKNSKSKKEEESTQGEMSRLFAPYRTVGVVTSGRPFHLIPHENSTSAMLCLPIGERFHILQCDKLQPVLVSQKVPSMEAVPQSISHLVSDATLSVTAVAHGPEHTPRHVTLFARTRPLKTVAVVVAKQRQKWHIQDLLHLGRMKVPMTGEKEGKMENAAIIAAILTKRETDDNDEDATEDVDVVGDSDDDENDDDSSTSDEDSEDSDASSYNDDDNASKCNCQVVILLATRETLHVHQRISLKSRPNFLPRVALHPSTYVNKIILGGSDQGKPALLLLNIRSGKVIHVFSCLKQKKEGTVTALAQSPAVDTVAVGSSNGKVHLINLRHDRTLFSLSHKPRDGGSKGVRVTSISFRTDGSAMNYAIAPMAVGRADGTITVWDLNPPDDNDDDEEEKGGKKKKPRMILCEMEKVHSGGVSKLMYLPQEPLMVSIGAKSNAVLMHIFDNPDHSGRILRQRKGHTAPPCKIRYLHPGAGAGGGILVNSADGTDAAACQILSSGGPDRTLRVFSTARTVLDKEYSQGRGLEKRARKYGMDSTAELLLPPLTGMAMSEARSRDWGNLITIHENHAMAYVWSTKRGAQSGPVLRQDAWNVSAMKVPPPPSAHAVSVAMSACGNFALVGTKGGVIYKYNVQSGNARGSYPRNATDDMEGKSKTQLPGDVNRTMRALEKKMKISNRASNLDKWDKDAVQEAVLEQRRQTKLMSASHSTSAVTGVAVDSTNKTLISVGADSKLILWNFAKHAPHKNSPYTLPNPATMLCHVRDSDLAAIALDDYSTVLFDCTTQTIVRRFGAGSAEQNRHSGPLRDLAFSPDGRTLYTASLDATVRVWDVPTNTCVDWLSFDTPPTSLTVSPTGEFLATTHTGKLGVSIWSDRSFYQTINVDGARELTQPFRMDEPRPIAEVWESSKDIPSASESSNDAALKTGEEDSMVNDEDSKLPAVAKEEGLITLSNLPPAHWKNLFHLELVKERNKPKEAPKKPPSAPFFLQWRGGEPLGDLPATSDGAKQGEEDEWRAAWSDDEYGEGELEASMADDKDDTVKPEDNIGTSSPGSKKRQLEPFSESRILTNTSGVKKKKISHHRSTLATLLGECADRPARDGHRRFQAVTDHIASLGPSAIDVSLSSLCNGMHDLEEGLPLLRMACTWLIEACESRERYEAVNAYLHRFLYLHATVIAGIDDSSWGSSASKGKELTTQEEEEKSRQDQERRELLESLAELRKAQQSALDGLRGRIQNSLCLLRHFSRMV